MCVTLNETRNSRHVGSFRSNMTVNRSNLSAGPVRYFVCHQEKTNGVSWKRSFHVSWVDGLKVPLLLSSSVFCPGRRPVFRVSHCIGDFIMSLSNHHEKHARELKMNVVLMVPESFGVKKQFNTVVLMPRILDRSRNFEVMVRIYGAQ